MDGQKVVKVFCHEEQNLGGLRRSSTMPSARAPTTPTAIANTIMPLIDNDGQPAAMCSARWSAALLASGGYLRPDASARWSSFLTLNKSFNQPINQVSQQIQRHHHGAGGRGARLRPAG